MTRLYTAYLTYIQNRSCKIQDESQDRIKIARTINNLIYADTTLIAKSEKELKNLLKKVKEQSEKNWLKTQHSNN